MKSEVDKLGVNKLTNVPPSSNNLKTKVDDWDVGKLKTVPVKLKKLNDIADNEFAKKVIFNTIKTKVNSLENNILDATNLIHINW